MYAGRKDAAAFETIAGELYTTLGAGDPTWAKVAELGVTVEPENPLYDISNIVSVSALATEELDVSDLDKVAVSTEDGLDFSLDEELSADNPQVVDDANSVVMQSFAAAENIGQDKSFDLGSVDDATSGDFAEPASVDTNFVSSDEQGSDSIEFKLPEIDSVEITTQTDAVVNQLANTDNHEFDLDHSSDNLMDFDLSDFNMKEDVPVESTAVTTVDDGPIFEFANAVDEDQMANLNLPTEAEKPAEATSSDPVELGLEFDFPNVETDVAVAAQEPEVEVEEISFALPSVDDEVLTDETETLANEIDANTFDFSAISLDLGEDNVKADAELATDELSVELAASTASENQDVDIKLDLVAAYIDMDDKEGARELLEEVIKEGGPQQKQRAEQLLASLV
jgi:pilus assembly protein FimV